MCSCMIFEVLKGLDPTERVLVDKHLNFDVRYDIFDDIITHKHYRFHTTQILPNVSLCRNGKCEEELCNAEVEEFEAARAHDEPHYILWDEAIGKKVLINDNGVVSFVHPDGDEGELDLNWKRLRSMAYPIVDEQLSKIVKNGIWKKTHLRVDLGTLMLDNNVVRYDKHSYNGMAKDEEEDMKQCNVAWDRKIQLEKRKRSITTQADGGHSKRSKAHNFLTHLDSREVEEDGSGVEPLMAGSNLTVSSDPGEDPEVQQPTVECYHCRDDPCVWLTQLDTMRMFDENEHAHLPAGDKPPNNIRRKKVYRQMFLHINQGTAGVGVRIVLPKCVEDGTRAMFPSPTFMGFKVR
jgi:hypothetical protein